MQPSVEVLCGGEYIICIISWAIANHPQHQILQHQLPHQVFRYQVFHFPIVTMRSYLLFGAAALVAASPAPAPQAFDTNKVAAVPATMTKGAPVGVGPASVTGVYDKSAAIATAEAAASGATTAPAVNKRSLHERTLCHFGIGLCQNKEHQSSSQPQKTTAPAYQMPTTTAPTAPAVTPMPSNVVPSTCTPVDWTNTWAFTSDPACPTAIEVGTFCGFINPLDPCAPQPAAYGPPTTPDTVEAFQKNPVYSNQALQAKTPSGYVQTFKNFNASVNSNSYLAYKILESYDVAGCAKYCDDTELCQGFNVYVERDPVWNPDQCSCKNPTSMAQYKCSIFGSGVEKSAATNFGEQRDDFQVVIVGSNGYEKDVEHTTPPTCPGYNNPQDCGTKLHDQPRYCIGEQSFPGPFDASLCAAYATKQNAVNLKAGLFSKLLSIFGFSNGKCVQFQAAELEVDGAGWGTHCRLFTKKFDKGQANLDISYGGSSKWSCGKSYTYDLA
jgi:hypothetical protein